MSILFVAPKGIDTNSDRARVVAQACPSVEVRDIDLNRLHEMPSQLTGVPTLVTEEDVYKGTDCLAALADNMEVQKAQPAALGARAQPAALGAVPKESTAQMPSGPMPSGPLNEKTSSFNSGTGPIKAEDIQNVLNEYRQGLS